MLANIVELLLPLTSVAGEREREICLFVDEMKVRFFFQCQQLHRCSCFLVFINIYVEIEWILSFENKLKDETERENVRMNDKEITNNQNNNKRKREREM